jgi:hypothetical protein
MQSAENVTRRGNRVSRRTISMTVPRARRVPRLHGVASVRDRGRSSKVLRQCVVGHPPRLGSARSSKRAQSVRNRMGEGRRSLRCQKCSAFGRGRATKALPRRAERSGANETKTDSRANILRRPAFVIGAIACPLLVRFSLHEFGAAFHGFSPKDRGAVLARTWRRSMPTSGPESISGRVLRRVRVRRRRAARAQVRQCKTRHFVR